VKLTQYLIQLWQTLDVLHQFTALFVQLLQWVGLCYYNSNISCVSYFLFQKDIDIGRPIS